MFIPAAWCRRSGIKAGTTVELADVIRALRHSSTPTTERFDARIRTERAWNDLERLWEAPSVRANSA